MEVRLRCTRRNETDISSRFDLHSPGILIFVTGRQEVMRACRLLRQKFGSPRHPRSNSAKKSEQEDNDDDEDDNNDDEEEESMESGTD